MTLVMIVIIRNTVQGIFSTTMTIYLFPSSHPFPITKKFSPPSNNTETFMLAISEQKFKPQVFIISLHPLGPDPAPLGTDPAPLGTDPAPLGTDPTPMMKTTDL